MYSSSANEYRRSFWRVRFSVLPNQVGFLFRKNQLEVKLEPGEYDYFDRERSLRLIVVPTTPKVLNVTNQEVLSKDNVAFRFSYFLEFRVIDPKLFLQSFDVYSNPYNIFADAEQLLHGLSQAHLRKVIAEIESESLSEKRAEIVPEIPASLKENLATAGIEITRLLIRDLTFPKSIQDVFAKQLEAKVRAKADLENARTAVAAARSLKNASELMKGDENVKFIQYLETITKIAEKGKHTFIIDGAANSADVIKKLT